MNIIVLDLEWNQSRSGREPEVAVMPFEIIEVGAVKLDENLQRIGKYDQLVRPKVYRKLHSVTKRLVHITMDELMRARPFWAVGNEFLSWCGEDYRFCTWGPSDLLELQRNIDFHKMKALANTPIPFLDGQKLFSIAYESDHHIRRNLEYAVDYLEIEKVIPFHRAYADAYYTARVLARTLKEHPECLEYISFDVKNPPKAGEEIDIRFPTYTKYISAPFPNREKAFEDKRISRLCCNVCGRALRKKVRWFTPTGKYYLAVGTCKEHGLVKSKARVGRMDGEGCFIIKTTRLATPEDLENIAAKKKKLAEQKRRRAKALAERAAMENMHGTQ